MELVQGTRKMALDQALPLARENKLLIAVRADFPL